MNQINALAQSVYPKMVEVRRALHQNPEPSMQEFETTRRLAAEMDRLGIPYRLTQPTGLIAQIEGAAPGPRVALRADIDAHAAQSHNRNLHALILPVLLR